MGNVGAIVGPVIVVVVLASIFIVSIIRYLRRRKRVGERELAMQMRIR